MNVFAGTVTVSWDANRENDLAGYRIYYGTSSGNYNKNIFTGDVTSYKINNLQGDRRYYFVVTAIDQSGNESNFSNEVDVFVPVGEDDGGGGNNNQDDADGALSPSTYNFPNPFRIEQEVTRIRYELLSPGEVTIEILDINTQLVRSIIKNQLKDAGEHTEDIWDGTNQNGEFVANGVYFCTITTGTQRQVLKIAVTR